jgi:exopolyphosphatase/guanosine-5'-triphosphate,3'-diphosphate pyrophosphatase
MSDPASGMSTLNSTETLTSSSSDNNAADTAYETYAAIDLGSNSFHMIVAREQEGQLHIVDRLREMVRLSGGLDDAKCLTLEAQTRALECLQRFGQRVSDITQGKVRAVGTNTLRSAHNSHIFLPKAEQALGHPIEIISGMEEARLIYLGVAHSLAADDSKRLVVDIGGGSTEVIIGEGVAPLCMESLYMGCVSMTMKYFPNGHITSAAWKRAEIAALMELEPIITLFRQAGWDKAIGASGTVKAVRNVVQAMGWSENGISAAAMKQLVSALKKAGHFDKIKLSGLSEERRPVFAGGVAVLNGIFKALKIEHMEVSDGALREGLLHDLLGRLHHEDIRGSSVAALAKRFQLDLTQAARIEDTVKQLLNQVVEDWDLSITDDGQWLSWAAQLHEVGVNIAHSHHHKHGAYIVQNADLSGFSQQEQAILAMLIRAHRRKFPKAGFESLPGNWQQRAQRLAVLLRLSVLLHRSRSTTPVPNLELQGSDNALTVRFPKAWLEKHSLTRADLEQEVAYLTASGFNLQIKE